MKKASLKTILLIATAIVSAASLSFETVNAQGGAPPLAPDAGIVNPLNSGDPDTTITTIIVKITQFLLGLTVVLAFLAIIVSGIYMVLSFGNEQKVVAAKRILIWAIIGFIVVLLAYAILGLIADLLGVKVTPDI